MDILIVGTGKLARELLEQAPRFNGFRLRPWAERGKEPRQSMVVHAGSGRELPDVCAYCGETGSVLIELATGSGIASSPDFPIVLCANTNILMLKFMSMLRTSGHLFRQYAVSLTESHQAAKKSLPGTAMHIAQSLGLDAAQVLSVRDAGLQAAMLSISPANLARHAFHEIVIEGGGCTVTLQSRVEGATPYVDGVAAIAAAVSAHALENRIYEVTELIERGWL
jgi:4-hydroxy-tetrahydrodipicolinate reductase